MYYLWVYDAYGDVYWNNRYMNLIEKFTISNEEYIDLKKHYFGEFTVDGYYMKKIASLMAQWNEIKDNDLKLLTSIE